MNEENSKEKERNELKASIIEKGGRSPKITN